MTNHETREVLSPEKIEEYRIATKFGAHLGVGGKALASILDSHEALRAKQRTPGTVEICGLCGMLPRGDGLCSSPTKDTVAAALGCPLSADQQSRRQALMLAISEVHSGNQAEAEKIVDAVIAAPIGSGP